MFRWFSVLFQLAGIALVVTGVCLWNIPAGLIVAGVLLFALGILLEANYSNNVEESSEG